MEESTIDAATQDPGVVPTTQPEEQPAETVQTASESPETTTESTDQETVEETTTSEDDFDYDAWLKKKGIDPSTPEGRVQVAKSWREMEKKMHSTTQTASELEKQISTQATVDPDASEAQRALAIATQLQNKAVIETWKAQNNISHEEDKAMGAYAKANPKTAELLTSGLLTLDEFRAIAVPAKPVDTTAIKKQGGQEALEKLANKQRATQPIGGAATPSSPTSDDSIEGLKSRLAGVKF
jgi:hypothetical protein